MEHTVNPGSVIHDFTGELSPGVIYHQSLYALGRLTANHRRYWGRKIKYCGKKKAEWELSHASSLKSISQQGKGQK
ncbi:MAG: hypothetical protein RBR41_11195 [Desulfovibrio sp.]|uniref:hypothetical protein n=1 Tax=Desulfovibrio sp. TaxID=885 RepID=UPI002A36F541|nr:hypothetical protein [Desulfovibrio sp.]MDY0260213.1 hypothetical protein [Desulfovibrio sp.]